MSARPLNRIRLGHLGLFGRHIFGRDPAVLSEAIAARRAELAACRNAGAVVVATETERTQLQAEMPDLEVAVVPETFEVEPSPGSFADRHDVLLAGTSEEAADTDAAMAFLTEIWPRISPRLPGVRCLVIGIEPSDSVRSKAGPGICFLDGSKTASSLQSCRVAVVPRVYASGMARQVGEALAAGLPLVATSKGIQGYKLERQVHAVIADSPDDFANGVVALYREEAVWSAFSAQGKALVEALYTREAVGPLLEGAGTVAQGGPRPERSEPGSRPVPPAGISAPACFANSAPTGEYLVSIVIPCWNRVEYTERCLGALVDSIGDHVSFEVVVVDNGSTDATPELCAGLEGDVQVITNDRNLGFARACNQGAAAARGRYIVFLNNDTEPRQGWLDALLRTIEEEPAAGIVGAKLLYPDGTIQHAGVVFTSRAEGKFVIAGEHHDKDILIDLLPYHIYRKMPADAPFVNKRRDFQAVTGACLLMENALFRKLGGFDEAYLNGFEDVDLCFRVLRDGRRVVYCPDAVVLHHESVSEGRNDRDLENARRLRESWQPFLVGDDERYYLEDGFVIERPRERLSIYRWNPRLAEAERLFAAGMAREALTAYSAFLSAVPNHAEARIKVAVLTDRLADTSALASNGSV